MTRKRALRLGTIHAPLALAISVALFSATACNTSKDEPEWPPPGPPTPTASPPRPNAVPARAASILRSSRSLQVLSVDPSGGAANQGRFHGWTVLGVVEVSKARRAGLAERIIAAVPSGDLSVAACFLPRHGVRAVSAEGSVDLIICFQCHQVRVVFDSGPSDWYVPSSDLQPTLNALLGEAGIPIAPSF